MSNSKEKKRKKTDKEFDINAWFASVDQETLAAERAESNRRLEAGADPMELLVNEAFRAYSAAMNHEEDTRPEVAFRLMNLFHQSNAIIKAAETGQN